MYVDCFSDSLRQGDVIKNFLICRTKLEKYGQGDSSVIAFKPEFKVVNVIVLSQCCDIEKRPYFFIVPLRKIDLYTERQPFFENLKSHKEKDPYNLFYYEPKYDLEEASCIDFSTAIPIEKSRLSECKEKKILELTIPIRNVFRKNLAANFGRAPAEDGSCGV